MLSYAQRAQYSLNPTGKRLLLLMDEKKTNLSVAADLTSQKKLLALADLLGPEICIFKIHVDILEDFTSDFPARLVEIAEKHNFLIFEDRKFADIGNTVKRQYQNGIYRIADWAHIVNAHPIPGPGIIAGLREGGLAKGHGLLLLAEMSSEGTFAKGQYTRKTVKLAEENGDFVIGFICIQKLSEDPALIHCTPGVHIQQKGDKLGQQYLTPEEVIGKRKSDLMIVGRGICEASDPLAAAKQYRQEGWRAYQKRLLNE